MTFKELYPKFVSGVPIKRKLWRGYWKCDKNENNVTIFTKEGRVLSLTETEDIIGTLSHTLSEDWEIATNDNCDIEVK